MRPECKLTDQNGNVFNLLLAIVRETLKENDLHEDLKAFDADLAQLRDNGGRYDDVLRLFEKYVDVI